MKTIYVLVKATVAVTLDETKFTPEFLDGFTRHFYSFDGIEDHAEHIGQLAARELYSFNKHQPKEFVEGYGPIGGMGISAEVTGAEIVHAYTVEELW